MNYVFSCNCINFRKVSNNITKIYDTAFTKVELKITKFSTIRNIQKLGKINIFDLSYLLELDRATILHNIKKLVKMDLVSNKYENNNKNKLVSLTTVGKNNLQESAIIWERTQSKYTKALGIKNYEKFETLIPKITKINI